MDKKEKTRQMCLKEKIYCRSSNIVYYIMLLALAVITLLILSVTVFLNTENIEVVGDSDYTDEQIIEASGLKGDENLVGLSIEGVPEIILDKLVSLDSVKVDKVLPSTIRISVERSVPMANISCGGKNYVISYNGRVMQIDKSEAECMHIIGYVPAQSVIVGDFISAEDEEQDELVSKIFGVVEKAGITGITQVDITESTGINLTIEDRISIYIGSIQHLDEKLRIANELLYNGYIEDTEFATLDVSDTSKAIQIA